MQLATQLFTFSTILFQLTVGQDIECPPEGVAYFPLEDCTKYLLCLNGVSSEIQCPAGLYFNPDIRNCDLPQNVPECAGGKRGVLTQCGQTMKANKGSIEYKLNQTYDAGELCVFILRHNVSSNPGFRFVLEEHGISQLDQDAIKIYTFIPHRTIWTRLSSDWKVLGPPNLIPVTTSVGYVAIVVFNTYSNSGTGFRLSFKATGDPDPTPGFNDGLDFVFNDETESPFTLPEARPSCTGFGCLDVFALTSDAKLVTEPDSFFRLTIILNPLPPDELGCLTSFSIMERDRSRSLAGGCWSNETRQNVYDKRGMFITVFVSYPESPVSAVISWGKRSYSGGSVKLGPFKN